MVSAELAGTRIAILLRDGSLLVKEGGLGADWVTLYQGVVDFQMTTTQVAILTTQGKMFVKRGALGANFDPVFPDDSGVSIQFSGRRYGMLRPDLGLVAEERAFANEFPEPLSTLGDEPHRFMQRGVEGDGLTPVAERIGRHVQYRPDLTLLR